MTDFGILLASPHNPIGCINWFEHPRVYGRISFTGDCTPHTKLYSQVTQTTFFGHDLFANLSAAWHLGQLLALYSRLAPAITNAWCCQKKSSRILETKFLAFSSGLNTCLLSRLIWGWVKHVKVFQGLLSDYNYYVWWFHNWISSIFFWNACFWANPANWMQTDKATTLSTDS